MHRRSRGRASPPRQPRKRANIFGCTCCESLRGVESQRDIRKHTHTRRTPPASGSEGGGGPGTNTHTPATLQFHWEMLLPGPQGDTFCSTALLGFHMFWLMHFLEGASSGCFSHVSESSAFNRFLLRFRNAGSDLLHLQA